MSAKILLDYVFPISVINPVPAASTAFLKQACVVAKPKAGQESNVGEIFECTTMVQVAARTENTNAQQLFNAGMSKVYILLADDLDLAAALVPGLGQFWTVLISDDFDDDDLDVPTPAVAASKKIQDILYTAKTAGAAGNDITVTYADTNTGDAATVSVSSSAISVSIDAGVTKASTIASAIAAHGSASVLVDAVVDAGDEDDTQTAQSSTSLEGGAAAGVGNLDVGTFDGMVGFSSTDKDVLKTFGTATNRCPFFTNATNKAKNMFFAFGKLLSNLTNWTNQQYITMPFNDNVEVLGDANSLFDDRISFVINDAEYGNRLAFFVAGGQAIVAPYITKNLRVDLQSRSVQWIAANQPQYTKTNAALLEQRLQEDVINVKYIQTNLIEAGVIEVELINDNFVASGYINMSEPKALWRIFGELRSTL